MLTNRVVPPAEPKASRENVPCTTETLTCPFVIASKRDDVNRSDRVRWLCDSVPTAYCLLCFAAFTRYDDEARTVSRESDLHP
jgi:hypothetical protein